MVRDLHFVPPIPISHWHFPDLANVILKPNMLTPLPDLNGAITVTNLQIVDLSNDFIVTQDLAARARISDRQAARIAYRSDLQHQALIQADRININAFATSRVEAEIARNVNSVLHEELSNDLAFIDKAGKIEPPHQSSPGDETSVREAIKCLTELVRQSGSASDVDAICTVLQLHN
jgi:hypothetical protein